VRALSERQIRIATNEALFREMNERVEAQVLATSGEDEQFVVACECGDIECMERLWLTLSEYEETHADPAQFVIVHGHEIPEVEEVVAKNERYFVVRKLGIGAEIARELDQPHE
jgi:hypothetical protein